MVRNETCSVYTILWRHAVYIDEFERMILADARGYLGLTTGRCGNRSGATAPGFNARFYTAATGD